MESEHLKSTILELLDIDSGHVQDYIVSALDIDKIWVSHLRFFPDQGDFWDPVSREVVREADLISGSSSTRIGTLIVSDDYRYIFPSPTREEFDKCS